MLNILHIYMLFKVTDDNSSDKTMLFALKAIPHATKSLLDMLG